MSKALLVDRNETETPQDVDLTLSTLRSSLLAYCTGLTGARESGEDIVQESMIKALPVIVGRMRHPNVKAYLFRIAKHTWLDHLKKRRTEEKYQKDVVYLSNSLYASGQELSGLDVEASIRVLLRYLTPIQRTVFLLRDVFEYTTHEVACLLGISELAVKGALHRARGRIQTARSADVGAIDQDVQKETLSAYMAAIQACDIPAILSLLLVDTVDSVQATVQVQTMVGQRNQNTRARTQSYGHMTIMMLSA